MSFISDSNLLFLCDVRMNAGLRSGLMSTWLLHRQFLFCINYELRIHSVDVIFVGYSCEVSYRRNIFNCCTNTFLASYIGIFVGGPYQITLPSSNGLFVTAIKPKDKHLTRDSFLFSRRAPQQMLHGTHRSLTASCATLWWRWRESWSVFFFNFTN
jgi:hypothetical protein